MPIAYESAKLKSWASDVEVNTLLQAEKAARLPIVYDHVALMPDAHVGLGATVGSVIPTKNAIIPAAVGVDIGCGMVATLTDLTEDDLPDNMNGLIPLIEKAIPAGVGKGHDSGTPAGRAWDKAATKLKNPGPATDFTSKMEATAEAQFGTLGSGNHFVEVCLDETGRVWTVLHSGSRGIGNQLANIHIKLAKAQNQALEDKDLAFFMQGTPEFANYIWDMTWAQEYAFGNRAVMASALQDALFKFIGKGKILDQINCHHNFTQQETFDGQSLWITRKGAIKAYHGDRGVIPGSMGTRSYIVSGKGVADSWCSCSHGAGRRMSRSQAKKELTADSLQEAMKGKAWRGSVGSNKSRTAMALLDEHPASYKSIDRVMEDQADLVTVDAILTQIVNFKGF